MAMSGFNAAETVGEDVDRGGHFKMSPAKP